MRTDAPNVLAGAKTSINKKDGLDRDTTRVYLLVSYELARNGKKTDEKLRDEFGLLQTKPSLW